MILSLVYVCVPVDGACRVERGLPTRSIVSPVTPVPTLVTLVSGVGLWSAPADGERPPLRRCALCKKQSRLRRGQVGFPLSLGEENLIIRSTFLEKGHFRRAEGAELRPQ